MNTQSALPQPKEVDRALQKVCELMTTLRGPNGCGWDKKQTLSSLKRYLVEETYETIDAIDELEQVPSAQATKEHLEELGDLLLQIVFQSEIQREKGAFDMNDVCRAISEKLIRRHPHIFGEESKDTSDTNPHWERIKEQERAEKGTNRKSVLDGIPKSMPALLRSKYIGAKASEAGFDWSDYKGARAKLSEEIGELDEVLHGSDRDRIEHELGDVMLSCTEIARHLDLDPEVTLRKANMRFEMRFRQMERNLKSAGIDMKDLSENELENYWRSAKTQIG